MAKSKIDIMPANWQVTAITIDCDRVHEYVTIMGYRHCSCRCTWWAMHHVAGNGKNQRVSRQINEQLTKCQGPDYDYVTGYRNKIIGEE